MEDLEGAIVSLFLAAQSAIGLSESVSLEVRSVESGEVSGSVSAMVTSSA